ncbi:MAG: hypothetical protein A2381_02620 [Bdellovibrionales bacterium RIFOXYB1_FULL_37_110]|nr:MAG: hypothetical protein A2181_05000 [Bdellovibrionales bacterium RIFOXYA1_FULL_38_20]OFZ52591.1 MAG: hypothetical protein A2417_00955 [Bdellovibrionales bacterium RIFOXYC1_FULL_37_79]OFZ58281.1 MAG: hypothetical protein A2381_02620 [Bdellovibrionales bacterium RIFOXYB1_FULL_37_110]OFZ65300.1 MAG: hypothetical protein A2577_04095 [Bdellovibrionales bacterium RIFOXYD1_FULL_36_51]
MRLTLEQQQIIIKTFSSIFKKNSALFLYGSRVDDKKKGGDIDLLIITDDEEEKKIAMGKKLDFIVTLKLELGDQKIDCLILSKSELNTHLFYQTIKDEMVMLHRLLPNP